MYSSEAIIYLRSAYSFLLASSTEALEHILIVVLVYLLVCLGIYKILFASKKNFGFKLVRDIKFPKYKRVLVAISHPDDECMFFGPTIRALSQRDDCCVYILCLSYGNFEEKGKIRRTELWKSCQTLGVEEANITLINATYLPDDPNVQWKIKTIAKILLNTIESLDIEALITFDRDGISQHPNHSAIYYATEALYLAKLIPEDCKIYTLDSINVLRKYISIFDLICTFLMSSNWCIIDWKEAAIIRNAMKQHKTQMKWFRRLYIIFSRYMFINSLREITLSDIELDMQLENSSYD